MPWWALVTVSNSSCREHDDSVGFSDAPVKRAVVGAFEPHDPLPQRSLD